MPLALRSGDANGEGTQGVRFAASYTNAEAQGGGKRRGVFLPVPLRYDHVDPCRPNGTASPRDLAFAPPPWRRWLDASNLRPPGTAPSPFAGVSFHPIISDLFARDKFVYMTILKKTKIP
jgi:hypothetical protein